MLAAVEDVVVIESVSIIVLYSGFSLGTSSASEAISTSPELA